MKVSLIIPNWNGEKKLAQNLPRILRTKEVDEFVVVDDGSTDDSVNIIKSFPKIKLIEKATNSGFSSTVNVGVKNSQGDLIFLLNSDAVPEQDCLKKALSLFNDKKVFSVGFNTGGSFAWAKFRQGFFWHNQSSMKINQGVHQTLWASGGSAIFRKDVWQSLGGFDELFDPFYEEDVDLGYRVTKRGFINLWLADGKVEHYHEKGVIAENFSKEKVARIAQRNQLLFIWKNITDTDLIRWHILALLERLLTKPSYWRVFFSAVIKLPQILKKRKIEQKQIKLSDKEILANF